MQRARFQFNVFVSAVVFFRGIVFDYFSEKCFSVAHLDFESVWQFRKQRFSNASFVVVCAALNYLDVFFFIVFDNSVNNAIVLVNSAAPISRQIIFQRLRLSDSFVAISVDVL